MTAMTDIPPQQTPRKTTAPQGALFWSKIADGYAAKPVANQQAYEATLARTREYLSPTDRVLEIGAGTASTALILAPEVAAYTASDYAEGMVAIGQRKARAAALPNLRVVQGQLGDAALGDGPFDAIFAFNLLHLCDDPAAEMAKAHDRLPAGGYFISKTPCLSGWMQLMRPVVGMMRLFGKAPKLRFFSKRRYETLLRDAGFEIVETGQYPAKSVAHFVVARKR
ncbi:bifunctional 2-polyprenyl-6-hydroxyphenol methylase/3-demethylubiquinol 3-O-methyltransferase UbiG [Pararhodobacter sp. CCB-MM2]|uniref:class I SAM-dependent methyltransferase n=1 Tax=Pararhodobacter sp. CCB-MM2 TaxID=1786003 RepID=UPI001F2CA072|nr:class I SAM-dependent methyltransferase [Pararhodobacter sp. CCB-MM2]